MTPYERARQIDEEEFRRDSEQALARALAYSKAKQEERRRQFLINVYRDDGKTMPLWETLPTETPALETTVEIRQRQPSKGYSYKPVDRIRRTFTVNGESLTLEQWADRLGVVESCLYMRAKKLGSIEAAIEQGANHRRMTNQRITYDGMNLSRYEWADHLRITYIALCHRIKKHGPQEAIAMGGPQRGKRARRANDNTPGVSLNLPASLGTGGGSTAQESPELSFPEKVHSA